MKTPCSIARRTPISRTLSARVANSRLSNVGLPNSLTKVAPGAEKRSVICVDIRALCSAASWERAAIRRAMRRAGITKTGNRTNANRVICQLIANITPSVNANVTMFDTTPESVSLNARCAPMTSLLSRLTSAPVRVRVKNATGIFWTWSKTERRRSRISPSPMCADNQRVPIPAAASATAISAINTASPTIVPPDPASLIRLTTRPARIGVTTVSTAVHTDSARNTPIRARCGRAKVMMRRSVLRRSPRSRLRDGEFDDLYIMSQATDCILMSSRVEAQVRFKSSRALR
ncbi:Uncharacterised protein [Mycobacteroides abscessus subsp. abscessus]|nr:Uncharacterised protein [Mycobacteroides abscessus subsp. abscessus]